MTEHGKKNKLSNITVCHIHTEGNAEYTSPDCEGLIFLFICTIKKYIKILLISLIFRN